MITVTAKSIKCKTPGYPLVRGVLDASPHHQTLRIKITFTGERNWEDATYTYRTVFSSVNENSFARKSVRGQIGTIAPFGTGLDDDVDDSDANPLDNYHPGAGEFTAFLQFQNTHIAKQQFFVNTPTMMRSVATRTRTLKVSPFTVTNLSDLFQNVASPPIFEHSGTPLNYRTAADVWRIMDGSLGVYASVDVSAWTNAQWRAKTGIHTASIAETSYLGGTSTVVGDYEWELS